MLYFSRFYRIKTLLSILFSVILIICLNDIKHTYNLSREIHLSFHADTDLKHSDRTVFPLDHRHCTSN